MSERLLFIDTETGGLDPEMCSLLSVGLCVWDNGKVIFEQEIYIKDDVYHTTSSALSINNIDIRQLDAVGLTKQAVINIIKGIQSYFFDNKPMVMVGHNVSFDSAFIKKLYKDVGEDYQKVFSHRMIDTASVLRFLYYAGVLKENIAASDKAFDYFNIQVNKRHSALGDCQATVELFNKLIALQKVE